MGVLRDAVSSATRPAIVRMELGGSDNFYQGRLDDVAVFDHALSASEVLSAQAGTFNPGDLIVKPNDVLAYVARIKNELLSPFANGLLSTSFPAQSVSASNLPPTTFILEPQQEKTIAGTVTVGAAAASGPVALTQVAEASIQDRTAQSNFAEAWIKFDESAGAVTFADYSGNVPAHNATCSNAAGQCPAYTASGASGSAFNFDGSNDVTRISGIDLANRSFSVAFWAKRTTSGRFDFAFGGGGSAGNFAGQALALGFRSNNKFTCGFNSDDLDTPLTYTDSDWHHWTCTYDASNRQRIIYRDGILVAQGSGCGQLSGHRRLAHRPVSVRRQLRWFARRCARVQESVEQRRHCRHLQSAGVETHLRSVRLSLDNLYR